MALRNCLWYDDVAEEAANYYVNVFRDGKLGEVVRYTEESSGTAGREPGSVMTVEFEIEGQPFLALNGGSIFQIDEAVSFIVERDTQEELDELWNELTSGGGEESQCGWCKDRFGVSWQVLPSNLAELMQTPEAVQALFQMQKIDIATLERASGLAKAGDAR